MEEKKLTDELEEMYVSGKFNGEIVFNAIKTIYALQEKNAEQKAKIERLEKDVHDMSWIIKIHKYCVGADHCQNSSMKEFKLQKQVDELEERVRELITDCDNCPLPRQAVKDTAKECYELFKFYKKHYYDIPLDLVARDIKEKTGLEVE